MKFGHLFEFHKIPEWYTEYIHYKELRDQIDLFKKFKKEGLVQPLNGYYTINKTGQIYCIDFIKNFRQEIGSSPAQRRQIRQRTLSDKNQVEGSDRSVYAQDSPIKATVEVKRRLSESQKLKFGVDNALDEESIEFEAPNQQLLSPLIVKDDKQTNKLPFAHLSGDVEDPETSAVQIINRKISEIADNDIIFTQGREQYHIRSVLMNQHNSGEPLNEYYDQEINRTVPEDVKLQIVEDLVPEISKTNLQKMINSVQVDAEVLKASEELTAIWISSFLVEINRVEHFFQQKLADLINQFILMQDKFRLKSELYENDKIKKLEKQLKKQQEKYQHADTNKQLLSSIINARINNSNYSIESSQILVNKSPNLVVKDTVSEGEEDNAYGYNYINKREDRPFVSVDQVKSLNHSYVSPMGGRKTNGIQNRSNISLIPEKRKYTNREELERYYKEVDGVTELETFLVPDMGDIQKILAVKGISLDSRVKDEFDHMINWQRVFESIWMQIRWLKSYDQINELALRKILKKFMKNFFTIKDNTIKKKLESILESKEFKKKDNGRGAKDLRILTEGVLQFYADIFQKGSKLKSRQVLDAQHNKLRVKDAVIMSLFLGATLIQLSFFIFFLCLPQVGDEHDQWQELSSGIETYIFTFVLVFIIVSTGVNIQIFRKFGINYAFIFEIDTKHKIIHHQLYRTSLVFFFMWIFCFVWQTAKIKLEIGFFDDYATFTLLLLFLFIISCVNPFPYFYRQTRLQILICLGHICASPFGLVRFRHFFLADVLTSIITPIQETMIIYCYFAGPEHNWQSSTKVNFNLECIPAHKIYTTLAFLPYWFRFAQCLRKYKDSEQKVHLINAGKYFSDLCVPFAALWYNNHKYDYGTAFWVWFSVHMFASTYSYAWDIYMDWGLLRSKQPGTYGLREKINYHPYFYYYAIVSDFILRFFWIIPIFQLGQPNSAFNTFQIMTFISIMAECFRRAQWSLIRVENEQNNNFEAYRTIPIIPPIVENEQLSTPEKEQD